MTTALTSRSAAETATGAPRPADAFVAFGITGDLPKVVTFRSPYRLEHVTGHGRRPGPWVAS